MFLLVPPETPDHAQTHCEPLTLNLHITQNLDPLIRRILSLQLPPKNSSVWSKKVLIFSHKKLKFCGIYFLQNTTFLVDMDDIFDSLLNLEDTHLKEGFDEGYKDGLVAGREEAKQVGLKSGFEAGEELGFYRGCVDVWKSAIGTDATLFSSRVQKGIKQMEELIEKYPLMEPENESLHEVMEGLRLKFRAVCATMGVKLEYNGYPKSSLKANDVEF